MINYNYAFSEKNGSLSFNSNYKDKNLKESTADLVKDELISVIQNQEQKITNISKIGNEQSFEFVINGVSPVSETLSTPETHTADIDQTLGTTDAFVFYFEYAGTKYIIKHIGSPIGTDLKSQLDTFITSPIDIPNIGIVSMTNTGIKVEIHNGLQTGSSGNFGYYQSIYNTAIYGNRDYAVPHSEESNGFTLKKGDTIVSQLTSKNYTSVTIDTLADDIIANTMNGFTIEKVFVNGVDSSQGIKMFVKYTPDNTNFDAFPEDFELKFHNEKGSISIAQ